MKPVDVGGRTHDHVRFVRCSLTGTNDDHPRVRKLHHRELARQLEHHIPTHQLTVEAGSLPDVARAIFLSQRSVTEAGYLNREIALALEQAEMQPEREIFIIPIRLEECTVPDRLTHLHWFELPETGFSVGQAYLRLQRSLVVRAMQAGRMQSGDLSQPWMEHMLYQKTIPDAYPVEDLEG